MTLRGVGPSSYLEIADYFNISDDPPLQSDIDKELKCAKHLLRRDTWIIYSVSLFLAWLIWFLFTGTHVVDSLFKTIGFLISFSSNIYITFFLLIFVIFMVAASVGFLGACAVYADDVILAGRRARVTYFTASTSSVSGLSELFTPAFSHSCPPKAYNTFATVVYTKKLEELNRVAVLGEIDALVYQREKEVQSFELASRLSGASYREELMSLG